MNIDDFSLEDEPPPLHVDLFLDTFEPIEEDERTARENLTNAYLRDLTERSKLHILQPERVNAAYDKHGSYGLFHLFITKSMFNCIRMWTNIKLRETKSKEVSALKFQAYLGLEMATSLLQYNSLKEYWSGKVFAGHDDFKKMMSRDDFFFCIFVLILYFVIPRLIYIVRLVQIRCGIAGSYSSTSKKIYPR